MSQYLVFDDDWGTNRGYCWRIGWQSYRELPFLHQLFGFGPDTYGIRLGISDRMRWIGMEFSVRAPTTNISSTLLQWDRLRLYLILRFWAAPACRCAKMERVRLDPAPVLAVLCYGAQAVVNINLPIATPIMWAMLAIGLALTREKAEQAE